MKWDVETSAYDCHCGRMSCPLIQDLARIVITACCTTTDSRIYPISSLFVDPSAVASCGRRSGIAIESASIIKYRETLICIGTVYR